VKNYIIKFLFKVPYLKRIAETRDTASPIKPKGFFIQKILGFNKKAYWPTHHSSIISYPDKIKIGIGTAPGLSNGCYIQGMGGIELGDYTIVAPGVGIISGNHNIYDYREHEVSKVKIGSYCWIGMNAVVLPGVILGDHTIVAAGAVVNKSFEDGYCVLGGVPAKVIKKLNPSACTKYKNKHEYYGYIPKKKFNNRKFNGI
jgi:acetyltransferase-like isoleucine patch superfamily enzyme